MSDDDARDKGAPQEPGGEQRPSPAAAAASRARRIGGRISGSRPTPDAGDTTADRLAKPAPGKPAEDEPASPRQPISLPTWLRWAPAGVLSAGAITMAVLLVVFSHGVWWGRPSDNAVRDRVLAAAKTCVAKTNTYKYNALDDYNKQVHACTTGALTGQIEKTITTVIKKYAPTLKATQTAQISRGGLEAVSPHGVQWTVLVFGQLTVVNTSSPKGRTDPFAAQVRMEKVHGKWVMSGLKTVSTPVS